MGLHMHFDDPGAPHSPKLSLMRATHGRVRSEEWLQNTEFQTKAQERHRLKVNGSVHRWTRGAGVVLKDGLGFVSKWSSKRDTFETSSFLLRILARVWLQHGLFSFRLPRSWSFQANQRTPIWASPFCFRFGG